MKDNISKYFDLVQQRPEWFVQELALELVLDEQKMREFAKKTHCKMGLVHNQEPFFYVVADLCRSVSGKLYSYARVLQCGKGTNGVVTLLRYKDSLGLMRVFRHGSRRWSLEAPRGYAELGLTLEENMKRELAEELGLETSHYQLFYLGNIRADAGLSSGQAAVFCTEILNRSAIVPTSNEGISGLNWYTPQEIQLAIKRGELNDSFTLSALALYEIQKAAADVEA